MSKQQYTVTTVGSRTIVHWEGKAEGPRAKGTNSGYFPTDAQTPPADDRNDQDDPGQRPEGERR